MQKSVGDDHDQDKDRESKNDRGHHQTIYVPPPGQKVEIPLERCTGSGDDRKNEETTAAAEAVQKTRLQRRSGGCAVCLNSFQANQKVTWSSNPECSHVFHHQCLMEWYTAVGTKAFLTETRRRERLMIHDNVNDHGATAITATRICDFPTLCPCCRRDYFLVNVDVGADSNDDDDDDDDKDNNNNNNNNDDLDCN